MRKGANSTIAIYLLSRQTKYILVLALLSVLSTVNAQYEFKTSLELLGVGAQDENPFWSRANTLGQLSKNTNALAILDAHYTKYLGDTTDISVGAAGFFEYGPDISTTPRMQSYYVNLNSGVFSFIAGAKPRDTVLSGLSTANGDILYSRNARPLPGLELTMQGPLRITRHLGLQGGIANYWLNDDRVVDGAMVHHKFMMVHWQLTRTAKLKAGMHHYAQWGGTSPSRGKQPSDFSAFRTLFIGGGGGSDAFATDQANALGNHIGSWRFHYTNAFRAGDLEVYFQNLFEDSSGQVLFNFPDGLWGAHWKLAEPKIFKSFLFEFLQTTWQSGWKRGSGNDNYFNNGTYASGWTYFGRTIGVPLLFADDNGEGISSNLIKSFHFGTTGKLDRLFGRFLVSYVRDKGTRRAILFEDSNFFEESVFLDATFEYDFDENWRLRLNVSGELNATADSQFGALLSLRYQFRDAFRF